MTPLARRIVGAVVAILTLALVVLASSLSLGPQARGGLVVLGAGLVVVGVIVAMLLRWFRKELADTNRTSAVEIAAEAGVDADVLGDERRPEPHEEGEGRSSGTDSSGGSTDRD